MTNNQKGWAIRIGGVLLAFAMWVPYLYGVAAILDLVGYNGGLRWVSAFFIACSLSIVTMVGMSIWGVSVQNRTR